MIVITGSAIGAAAAVPVPGRDWNFVRPDVLQSAATKVGRCATAKLLKSKLVCEAEEIPSVSATAEGCDFPNSPLGRRWSTLFQQRTVPQNARSIAPS